MAKGPYVPLSVSYRESDKMLAVEPLAELLFVRSLAFAGEKRSDGIVTLRQVQLLARDLGASPESLTAQLVRSGAFIEAAGNRYEIAVWREWTHSPKRERRRLTPSLRWLVIERDGPWCSICGWPHIERGAPDGVGLEVDHVVPLCRGGTSDLHNLTVLCRSCNRAKGKLPMDEFMRGRP